MHLRYKNFVYTPIPKVACTTIKSEYIRLIEKKRRKKGKVPFARVIDITEVHKFFEKIHTFRISEEDIVKQRLFHFIFIRDPYDRLVSGYLSKIRNEKRLNCTQYFEKGGVAKKVLEVDERLRGGVTFNRFMDILSTNEELLENLHFYPQSNFLSDHGWETVDYIGHMETFGEDWEEMCKISGFPYRELARMNSSKIEKKYRDFFSPRNRKIAEDIYGEDLERFKYKF
jgi:hypothetical protein